MKRKRDWTLLVLCTAFGVLLGRQTATVDRPAPVTMVPTVKDSAKGAAHSEHDKRNADRNKPFHTGLENSPLADVYEQMWIASHCKEGDQAPQFPVPSSNVLGQNGMVIPYEVKWSNKTGRGVYVTRQVKKGEMVWSGSRVVAFLTEGAYRAFLNCLQQKHRRDAVMWSWFEASSRAVHLALDDGSLVNHNSNPNTGSTPDCFAGKLVTSKPDVTGAVPSCLNNNYAARDIAAGEEITDDYQAYTFEQLHATKAGVWWDAIESEYSLEKKSLSR